jgi:prepilin-type processing-associated H-X9-DG protein
MLTKLLPYFEQDNMFKQYDFTLNWYDPPNLPVTSQRIKILLCPSTPNPERLDGRPDAPWVPLVAVTDYGATTSVSPLLVSAGLADQSGSGMIPKDTDKPRFADVTDGLSNTICLAESAGRPTLWRHGLPVGGPPTPKVNGGGWSRAANDFSIEGSTADGTQYPGPCAINCTNGFDYQAYPDAYYGKDGSGEVYSFHTGGANCLFGDGSVHLVHQSVSMRTFAALVTRGGAEVPGNDY